MTREAWGDPSPPSNTTATGGTSSPRPVPRYWGGKEQKLSLSYGLRPRSCHQPLRASLCPTRHRARHTLCCTPPPCAPRPSTTPATPPHPPATPRHPTGPHPTGSSPCQPAVPHPTHLDTPQHRPPRTSSSYRHGQPHSPLPAPHPQAWAPHKAQAPHNPTAPSPHRPGHPTAPSPPGLDTPQALTPRPGQPTRPSHLTAPSSPQAWTPHKARAPHNPTGRHPTGPRTPQYSAPRARAPLGTRAAGRHPGTAALTRAPRSAPAAPAIRPAQPPSPASPLPLVIGPHRRHSRGGGAHWPRRLALSRRRGGTRCVRRLPIGGRRGGRSWRRRSRDVSLRAWGAGGAERRGSRGTDAEAGRPRHVGGAPRGRLPGEGGSSGGGGLGWGWGRPGPGGVEGSPTALRRHEPAEGNPPRPSQRQGQAQEGCKS